MSSAVGGGVLDRILYAPGRQRPRVILNAVDDDLKDFLTEVSAWTRDPKYFEGFTQTRSYSVYVSLSTCFRDLGKRYCRWRPVVSYSGTYEEYTNSSDEAREFAEQFSLVDGRIDPDVTLGGQKAANIDRLLADVFGAPFLNGALTRNCPLGGSIDGLPCNDTELIGDIVLRAIEYALVDVDNDPPNADGSVDSKGRATIQPGEYRLLAPKEIEILRENGFADLTDPNAPVDSIENLDKEVKVFHHAKRGDDATVPYKVNRLYVYERYPDVIGMPQCNSQERKVYPTCYTDEFEGIEEVTLFIHEATHIWQNDVTMRTDIARDAGKYANTYHYRLKDRSLENKDFSCFTREQQAEMVADLYRLRQNENSRLSTNNSHGTMNSARRQAAITELEAIVPIPLPGQVPQPGDPDDPCAGAV